MKKKKMVLESTRRTKLKKAACIRSSSTSRNPALISVFSVHHATHPT